MRIKFFWGDVTVPCHQNFHFRIPITTPHLDSILGSFPNTPVHQDFTSWLFVGLYLYIPQDWVFRILGFTRGSFPLEETFIQECEVLREELTEHQLKIEGQYLSKHDMKEKLNLSEPPESINVTHTSSGADIGFDFES